MKDTASRVATGNSPAAFLERNFGPPSVMSFLDDKVLYPAATTVPDDTIMAILLDRRWGISESVLDKGSRASAYAARQIERAHQVAENFKCNEAGKIIGSSQFNIRLAMGKLGVTVSQNEFANKGHIQGLTGYGPVITDAALLRLWLLIDETFRFMPKKDFFFDVVDDLARQNPFHPVRDYLDTVEPTWDGTPRLDQWLSTYCGADHSAYTGAVGSLCLIAAVRRVRQPGVKFDEMVVLESAQGTDKSSALATLAKNPEWFTDDLPLNADTKVLIERTQGKWIVEAAELSGLKKSDIEGLKALLSRREDRARPAYGRLTVEVPRQYVFVGTTNNATYLTDPTGNRRFWPVAIAKFDLPALKRDLDQLWGEAAHREGAGESIRLDPSLWGVAAEEQDARRIDDPMAGALDHHLCGVTGKIRTVDLWQLLDVSLDQRMRLATSLAKAMQELGWTKTKVRFGGPNPERGYVKGTILERQIQLRTNKFGVALDASTQKDAA